MPIATQCSGRRAPFPHGARHWQQPHSTTTHQEPIPKVAGPLDPPTLVPSPHPPIHSNLTHLVCPTPKILHQPVLVDSDNSQNLDPGSPHHHWHPNPSPVYHQMATRPAAGPLDMILTLRLPRRQHYTNITVASLAGVACN